MLKRRRRGCSPPPFRREEEGGQETETWCAGVEWSRLLPLSDRRSVGGVTPTYTKTRAHTRPHACARTHTHNYIARTQTYAHMYTHTHTHADWLPQEMHKSKLIWKENKVGTVFCVAVDDGGNGRSSGGASGAGGGSSSATRVDPFVRTSPESGGGDCGGDGGEDEGFVRSSGTAAEEGGFGRTLRGGGGMVWSHLKSVRCLCLYLYAHVCTCVYIYVHGV